MRISFGLTYDERMEQSFLLLGQLIKDLENES